MVKQPEPGKPPCKMLTKGGLEHGAAGEGRGHDPHRVHKGIKQFQVLEGTGELTRTKRKSPTSIRMNTRTTLVAWLVSPPALRPNDRFWLLLLHARHSLSSAPTPLALSTGLPSSHVTDTGFPLPARRAGLSLSFLAPKPDPSPQGPIQMAPPPRTFLTSGAEMPSPSHSGAFQSGPGPSLYENDLPREEKTAYEL